MLKDLVATPSVGLHGRRPRDDAADPRRGAGLDAGVLHGVREPGGFRRGHPSRSRTRARRSSSTTSSTSPSRCSRTDHRAGGGRVNHAASRTSRRPATTRGNRTSRRSGSPEEGLSGARHNFAHGRKASTPCRACDRSARSVTLLSFQWDQPCFSATAAGSASTSTSSSTMPTASRTHLHRRSRTVVCQFPGSIRTKAATPSRRPSWSTSRTRRRCEIGDRAVLGPAPNRMKYVWFDLDAGFSPR